MFTNPNESVRKKRTRSKKAYATDFRFRKMTSSKEAQVTGAIIDSGFKFQVHERVLLLNLKESWKLANT